MRIFALSCALAFATGAATADTVRLDFEGTGSGRNVRVTIGGDTFGTFAGQLIHSFSNGNGVAAGLSGNRITFCSDLSQYVASGGATYNVTSIQNLPGSGPMGASKMQAIYDMYAAAAGSQMGANDDMAAAFQLAVWEVIYDYDPSNTSSLNLSSGNLKARNSLGLSLSSTILNHAAGLFSAIGSNAAQTGLLGFTNSSFQDQILQVQLVPIPMAVIAGLAGLGMVGYVRRRRTR